MYKSQLLEYTQMWGLPAPAYSHVEDGEPHDPRFQSTHESGVLKNLLQEYAQKHGYGLPQYKIMQQGEDHLLLFSATVEIAGVSYRGGFAKKKKDAEIKAAGTALMAIQAIELGNGSPAVECSPLPGQAEPQITAFINAQSKKKRGRQNAASGEPMATRLKQGLGFTPRPVQVSQTTQVGWNQEHGGRHAGGTSCGAGSTHFKKYELSSPSTRGGTNRGTRDGTNRGSRDGTNRGTRDGTNRGTRDGTNPGHERY